MIPPVLMFVEDRLIGIVPQTVRIETVADSRKISALNTDGVKVWLSPYSTAINGVTLTAVQESDKCVQLLDAIMTQVGLAPPGGTAVVVATHFRLAENAEPSSLPTSLILRTWPSVYGSTEAEIQACEGKMLTAVKVEEDSMVSMHFN